MASFSDQISQFNPYIQQLPVETMAQVGMYKQQKYDQGVQKIQSYVDDIAGIDVLNPTQKQYVQSKLDDLSGRLKSVAAGDFSNSQLVNSVGGMATSIMKDSKVQNAVLSTQKIRQGMADKTAANKAGKASPDNDWLFNNDVSTFMADTNVDASFNSSYIQYKDLTPKMTEVLKSLHESGTTTDIPWETDSKGNVLYGQTAKAMVEKGWKGVTSAKIENAIRASLDPSDLRQLQISGMYQFRDYKPEDLNNYAIKQYEAGINSVNDKITKIQKYAALHQGDKNIQLESTTTIAELKAQIGEKGDYRNQLKDNLEVALANIKKDPNAVKAELYTNGYIKQFANGHSWEETVAKYMENPILAADHWTSTFNFNKAVASEAKRHNLVGEGLARDNYNLDFWEKHGGQSSFVAFGGTEQWAKDPNTIVNEKMVEYKTAADNGVFALAAQIQAKARKSTGNDKIVITTADVDKMIDGSYSGPVKNPIGPEYKSSVASIIENRRQVGLHSSVIANAKEFAANDPELKELDKLLGEDLVKTGKKDLVLKDANGRAVVYSPREQLSYVMNFRKQQSGSFTGTNVPLSDKEKLLDAQVGVGKIYSQYKSVLEDNAPRMERWKQKTNDYIAERSPNYAPKLSTIQTPSPVSRVRWETMAGALTNVDSMDKSGWEDWDGGVVKSWLADSNIKNSLQYSIFDNGVVKQLWVTGPDGKVQKRTLSSTDIAQTPEAQTDGSARLKGEAMMAGGTTNVANNTPQGAKWQTANFPLIQKHDVVADFINDGLDPNVVFPQLQIRKRDGEYVPLILDKPMTVTNVREYYNQLNDTQITDLVNRYLPSLRGNLYNK